MKLKTKVKIKIKKSEENMKLTEEELQNFFKKIRECATNRPNKWIPLIVKLGGYEGNKSYLRCGVVEDEFEENSMYMVIDARTGEEIDIGYPSFDDAKKVFPNAININSI